MPYERPNIQALAAYVPGEQPSFRETSGAAGQYGGYAGGIIKLNTNENPYPPSPAVMSAIRELSPEALRLYPPADAGGFRKVAGEVHSLTPDQVIATNGGDELLRLLITVFCPPGEGGIGTTSPSYTLYPVLAEIQDTPITIVDRPDSDDGGFALPDNYADRLNAADVKLAFLVNPHAPTGRLESLTTLRKLADDFRGVLVIDEAYADFAPHNALPLLTEDRRRNVVILRSLSKGYSLAGLRFGYGLADASLIAAMDKARDSYNTDILSQAAATAALRDQAYAQSTWDRVITERARLTQGLRQRGFTVPESHSNFVLAAVPRQADASDTAAADKARHIYESLKSQDVLIRYFSKDRLTDRLRITVGTAAQNDRFFELLDSCL